MGSAKVKQSFEAKPFCSLFLKGSRLSAGFWCCSLSGKGKLSMSGSISQLSVQFTECCGVAWVQQRDLIWQRLSRISVSGLIRDWADRKLNEQRSGPMATPHRFPPPLSTACRQPLLYVQARQDNHFSGAWRAWKKTWFSQLGYR